MNPKQPKVGKIIILVLLSLMLLWQSVYVGNPNNYISPMIWMLAGMLIPVFIVFNWTESEFQHPVDIKKRLAVLLCFVSLGISVYDLYQVFQTYPISASLSDVIPSLEVYVRRLLAGEKVYVEIPFSNYSVKPTYFPAMWLPYVVPELLGFDYRWMAFGCFYLSVIYIIYREFDHIHTSTLVAIAIFHVLMIKWIIHYDVNVFSVATELMPATFYIWLIYTLYRKQILGIGIALALCTMSRYAYSLWIIPFIYIVWTAVGFKTLFRIGMISLGLVFVLYVLPFLLFDPSILMDGFSYYKKTVEDQWTTQFWQPEGSFPFHLNRGFSFSYWFFNMVEGSHIEKVAVARNVHLVASLIAVLFIVLAHYILKKRVPWNHILILGLLFFIVVFYAFLYVPFSYLYLLPLSMAMLVFILYSNHLKI